MSGLGWKTMYCWYSFPKQFNAYILMNFTVPELGQVPYSYRTLISLSEAA